MAHVAAILSRLSGLRLCVVGDLLLDVYVWGRVDRISPEAPVPVVVHERTTHRASGAATAAQPAAGLCAGVEVVTVAGTDDDGRLAARLAAGGGVLPHVVPDGSRPTPRKTRVVAQGQQLVRIDREDVRDIDRETAEAVCAAALAAVGRADAVLVSDYAKGVCVPAVVGPVIRAARAAGKPVVVDPKRADPARYAGATLVTPNTGELDRFAAHLGCTGWDPVSAARRVRAAGGFDWVAVTRAAEGMTLVGDGDALDVPAYAKDVVDVAGAGDAVAAVLALCLAAGVAVRDGARFASLVAGLVIRHLAHKRVTPEEVLQAAERFGVAGDAVGDAG